VKRLLAVLVVLALLVPGARLLAPVMGRYLVKAEAPVQADLIVVLAGDGFGNRIRTAAELAKQGYAPKVLVSGPDGNYGNHECDLAIPFAVKAGYPEAMFLHFEHRARSTEEETRLLAVKLKEMGVRKVLVVTSDFHTRRAGKIFRRLAPDVEAHVVAAPDEYFHADSWWKNREGRKTFLLEWVKTVAEY
jgi:uncharacterized SAM-binding protein YcdF (DUF218 family)